MALFYFFIKENHNLKLKIVNIDYFIFRLPIMYKLNLLTESEIGELGIMKAFMYVYVIINDKWSTHCLQGFELENLYKKSRTRTFITKTFITESELENLYFISLARSGQSWLHRSRAPPNLFLQQQIFLQQMCKHKWLEDNLFFCKYIWQQICKHKLVENSLLFLQISFTSKCANTND